MADSMSLDPILQACSPGGGTSLTSKTELEPAAGPYASVAPAKFAARGKKQGAYAYERRYLDGEKEPQQAVLIDTKQSQLNRVELALMDAIKDGHPLLSRLPLIVVSYERDGSTETYCDLQLPHRLYDGHNRAGSIDGQPATQHPRYRALRDANVADASAILSTCPFGLIGGAWDATRATRQGRWRSALVGEIIGFCADTHAALKGGARTDPVGMQVKLPGSQLKALADRQRHELSANNYNDIEAAIKKAKPGDLISGSALGLGGIPPTLETLAGVACHRIIRTHVLSFATLRQIRFGKDLNGDAACRALLAALALNALARSDSELFLRANCDLREKAPTEVRLDRRWGAYDELSPLSISEADALLADALERAERAAGVDWHGQQLKIQGDQSIIVGAVDANGGGDE